jgi:hypothetical protein
VCVCRWEVCAFFTLRPKAVTNFERSNYQDVLDELKQEQQQRWGPAR